MKTKKEKQLPNHIYIVVLDHGAQSEPEMLAFEDPSKADDYASVRGSVKDIYELELMDELEAEALIKVEAKERAEEERADRLRDEGRR